MSLHGIDYRLRMFIGASIVLLTCGLTEAAFSQISQPHRYERKQKGSEEFYTIISIKEEGIALLRNKEKYTSNKVAWELIFIDTALQEKKIIEFEVSNKNSLVGHEYVKGELYLLYRVGDANKNKFELIQFAIAREEVLRYEISSELEFNLTHFTMAGANMIIAGYVSKEPVVLIYELTTKLIKVVPGFFQKDNELRDLRVNQNLTFNTVVIDRSNRVEKKVVFKTFDEHGKVLLEDIVPIDDIKSVQTSITSSLEREELMVFGTWGNRQAKQSAGFYALSIDPFNEQKINYIDFAQLHHFMDYMKPAKAKRIKENSEADIKAGRNPDFSNYLMPFRLEEYEKGFLLLAEVYTQTGNNNQPNGPFPYQYPMYGMRTPYVYNTLYGRYMPSPYYNMYGSNNYNQQQKSAIEFHTTQAVLLAIDAKGNLLWDQSMEIKDDTKWSELGQKSDFHYEKEKVVFIYKGSKNELKVKIIDLENAEVSELTEKLKLLNTEDEFRSERDESSLRQWYGNSFYVWGYQTIRNINNKEDRVRDVFYINKIVVK